ncbi:MAG: hypothetical protein IAE92_12685 [Burkholderiaceae bacterium]|jgi:hypothetical protein|nr:hypothetical protein [Burkholderiaceae bacterium]
MHIPTQEEINDTIEVLLRDGRLLAYRDEAGEVHFSTAEWAAEHGLAGVALSASQVTEELSAIEAELMAEWN